MWFSNCVNLTGSLLVSCLSVLTFIMLQLSSPGQASAPKQPLNAPSLPYQIGNWKGQDLEGLGPREKQTLQLDSYIRRSYTNSLGQNVFVYVGYWQQQSGEHQAAKHSPVTCLPANGWKVYNPQKQRLQIGPRALDFNRLDASFGSQSNVFYYWFFSGSEEYEKEWQALYRIALGNFLRGRADGGIVEISTVSTESGPQQAQPDEVLESFLREFYPELRKLIEAVELAS